MLCAFCQTTASFGSEYHSNWNLVVSPDFRCLLVVLEDKCRRKTRKEEVRNAKERMEKSPRHSPSEADLLLLPATSHNQTSSLTGDNALCRWSAVRCWESCNVHVSPASVICLSDLMTSLRIHERMHTCSNTNINATETIATW
jgi:hypothetical protein